MGLLKKITRGAKKVVRKVVPKEVAGIMQVAAPFVAPYSLPGALALSLGGQLRSGQGKINPFSTLMAVAPSEQFRSFTRSSIPGGLKFDEFLYGTPQMFIDTKYPVKPHVGQIFFFPAWLLHEVYPFRGKGLRRTISFNLSFEM